MVYSQGSMACRHHLHAFPLDSSCQFEWFLLDGDTFLFDTFYGCKAREHKHEKKSIRFSLQSPLVPRSKNTEQKEKDDMNTDGQHNKT
eukprot:m.229823 g.229823  ORF g.229823 m.229823 type:complete len:88 (+) comp33564_c10_seq3:2465-2728(+)